MCTENTDVFLMKILQHMHILAPEKSVLLLCVKSWSNNFETAQRENRNANAIAHHCPYVYHTFLPPLVVRLMVSASQDGKLLIWDTHTGNKVSWRQMNPHKALFHRYARTMMFLKCTTISWCGSLCQWKRANRCLKVYYILLIRLITCLISKPK